MVKELNSRFKTIEQVTTTYIESAHQKFNKLKKKPRKKKDFSFFDF